MGIANTLVKMQVDLGASCDVLLRKFLPWDTDIKRTVLRTNLKVLGVAKISLRNPKNKKRYLVEFAIIDEDCTPLLCSSAAQQMGLITVQQENILQAMDRYEELNMEKITATYPDVFQGLGCMERRSSPRSR